MGALAAIETLLGQNMARLWNATWPEGFAVIAIREVTGERKLKRSRQKSTKCVIS
jgi:hypothetical protein